VGKATRATVTSGKLMVGTALRAFAHPTLSF
jgi:hypothetical protein